MNRLWKKSAAMLLTLTMLICQMAVFAANETADVAEDGVKSTVSAQLENYVKTFGVFEKSEIIDDTEITRQQAANYFVKATGFDYSVIGGDKKTFDDVTQGSAAWKAAEAAILQGIVTPSENRMFYPTRPVSVNEAVTMAVRTMGAEAIALDMGGYPNGYLAIARESDLLYGLSGKDTLTKADMANLIYNMLTAEVYDIDHNSVNGQLSYRKHEDYTVVEELLDVRKYRVEFLETDISTRKVTVKYIGDYKNGVVETLYVDKSLDISTLGGRGNIYYRAEDTKILFIEVSKGSEVVYDYVSAVNKENDPVAVTVGNIRNITLKNANVTYKVSDDVAVYYNEKKVDYEANTYHNCFAKVTISDKEIVRIDTYPLQAGGAVTYAINEELRFSTLEDTVQWNDMDQIASLEVYLDGKLLDALENLKKDYVFDYYYNRNDDRLILVASSRAVYGTVTGYGTNKIYIDKVAYDIDFAKNLDFNQDNQKYEMCSDYSKLLNNKVTILFDDNKTVRFTKIDSTMTDKNKIRGIVLATDENETTEVRQIKLFNADVADSVEVYEVADKLLSPSGITFDDIVNSSNNDESFRKGESFFEFTLNAEGKIRSVDYVPYFGNFYKENFTYADDRRQMIENQYAQDAKLILLLIDPETGKYSAEHSTWSKLIYVQANHTTGNTRCKHPDSMRGSNSINGYPRALITDYDLRYNPVPNYIMYSGYEEAHEVFGATGVINKITYNPDDTATLLMAGNSTLKLPMEYLDAHPELHENVMVQYTRMVGSEIPMSIDKVRDFSGDPSTWTTTAGVKTVWPTYTSGDSVSNARFEGLYKADGFTFKNEYAVQFIVNGEPIDVLSFKDTGINSGEPCAVYEYNGDTIAKASQKLTSAEEYTRIFRATYPTMLRKGDNIWFYVDSNKDVAWFIIEEGGNSYAN